MSSDADSIPRGTLIDGRYEIRDHLGRGGMGTVYRARDTKKGQPVALKMLLQGERGEKSREERRRRFMNEIYAINEVAHRNVVQVLEFGFHGDTPFMVMELLKGKDLGRVIHDQAGPLPIDYCVDVMLVICAAIQACHHKGIIHRDLKPGNVMVIDTDSGPGWDVKVLDFSISSISKVAGDLTRDGQILGTPRYLSPEQVSGKTLPASDQYAIGLLLYVCLTKQHPFADLDGAPLIRAIDRGDIPPSRTLRPEIPEALEAVILKAISVDPGERYARVHDLGRALWPFGSPLGQGLWKKYYFETPRAAEPDSTLKGNTTSVPLVLQMAKGEVPMVGSTAVAHYQSTTAVPAASAVRPPSDVTQDDPEAPRARAGGPSAPTGWAWQSSLTGAAGSVETAETSRTRGKLIGGALIVAAAVAVGAVVGIGKMSRPGTTAAPGPAMVPAPAPVAQPPAPPALPAAATAPAPAPAAPTAAAPSPAAARAPAPDEKKSKHREHARKRSPTASHDGWEVDANGVPIPPP
ncbi:MAG TPA: serine/threonine-protein kinase [Polyangia bacterium]|nr:serine/threonine-protein kinase [Polyangia bacterium]